MDFVQDVVTLWGGNTEYVTLHPLNLLHLRLRHQACLVKFDQARGETSLLLRPRPPKKT